MPRQTATPYQVNTRQLKDGCYIYQIGAGHKGGNTGIWHYRINIENGRNRRRTTHKTNESEAEDIALAAYYEARKNITDGVPNIDVNMRRVIKEWLVDEYERIGQEDDGITQSTYDNYSGVANKYILEFFGGMNIKAVDDTTIKQYWKWRKAYYKNEKNIKKTKGKHIAVNPKPNTLQQDQNCLNRMFRFAADNRYIHKREIPTVARRKEGNKTNSRVEKARTAYSAAEMEILYQALDDEVDRAVMRKDKLARRRIKHLVHVMAGAGLRAVEVRHLRWRDVTDYKHPNGDVFLRLWVQGKTPPRPVMASIDLKEHFKVMKEINWKHCGDDDLVFASQRGTFPNHAHKTFKRIAIAAGVFYDKSGLSKKGVGRPLTSMRHTYITNALSSGSIPIDMLAANCGNSVGEIERTYRHIANELNAPNVVKDGGGSYSVRQAMKQIDGDAET